MDCKNTWHDSEHLRIVFNPGTQKYGRGHCVVSEEFSIGLRALVWVVELRILVCLVWHAYKLSSH
eukprot:1159699-Pelagomonas_calceolata.AAC.19